MIYIIKLNLNITCAQLKEVNANDKSKSEEINNKSK